MVSFQNNGGDKFGCSKPPDFAAQRDTVCLGGLLANIEKNAKDAEMRKIRRKEITKSEFTFAPFAFLLRLLRSMGQSPITRLNAIPIKGRFIAFAIHLQSTLLSHGIGPLEDPVLPSGEAAKHSGGHGLDAVEAQVGF